MQRGVTERTSSGGQSQDQEAHGVNLIKQMDEKENMNRDRVTDQWGRSENPSPVLTLGRLHSPEL